MAGLEAMACSMACWLSVTDMWGACVCCARSFDGDQACASERRCSLEKFSLLFGCGRADCVEHLDTKMALQ